MTEKKKVVIHQKNKNMGGHQQKSPSKMKKDEGNWKKGESGTDYFAIIKWNA